MKSNHLSFSGTQSNSRTNLFNEASRVFLLLAVLTFSILMILGTAILLQAKLLKEPVLSMKGLAPAMSSPFFADMIRMELPGFAVEENNQNTFSNSNVLTFLLQVLTNVNPRDPKSLLAGEVPGIRDDTVPLRKGIIVGEDVSPADYAPPKDVFADKPDENILPVDEVNEAPVVVPNQNKAPILSTDGKKVVFIYHSHNRESWLPELKDQGVTNMNKAYDSNKNITLVGKRLSTKLVDLGIGASHSATDYPTAVKSYNWNFSYKYSHKTVETAFASNPDLTYFFDIHRDSQRRDLTTTKINGKSYAQVYFIIGHRNPNWRKNEQFATAIHEVLQEKYPDLSRGIWGKGANNGNGEYNQSISPNSILIEIGGPENTLEESYRTADVLANVIANIYWDAEKVSAGG
ncbi:MAG: stage II sporulation protein P [Paenibacillaceae bacterium]